MAKYNYNQGETPDASFGLIYRLNKLWSDADDLAFQGRLKEYNIKLDRIFANLLFKEELVYKTDEHGKTIKIELNEKDQILYEELNKDYLVAKKKVSDAIKSNNKSKYVLAHNEMYQALLKKDYALRKFEYELGLYLKKSDGSPAHSMWGR